MDANTGMDVFAIREARPHPWVISTTRHLSQGGVSLLDEQWNPDSKVLSGKSAVVVGDPYVMTVHLPDGYRLQSAQATGEKIKIARQNETATVRFEPSATGEIDWRMVFSRIGP